MECMCAPTGSRSTISSERVLGEWSQKPCFFLFFLLFFLRSPAISLGFTTFGWDFCVCDRFFNPTIKVVTFRLRGWCVLGVFLLPVYTLIGRSFGGNGVWTHVNSKGKIPSTGKCPQRRIEPATSWTASPCTTNWATPAPRSHVNSKGKIPFTGGSEEGWTCDAASHRTASPTHYRLSYASPLQMQFVTSSCYNILTPGQTVLAMIP